MKYEEIEDFTEMFLPSEIRNDGSILPQGWWEPNPFVFELRRTENSFLQSFLDRGHRIFNCLQELTVYIADSILWVRIFDDHTRLEYMCTYDGKRRHGSGKHSMETLVEIADATNTTLKLSTDVVLEIDGQTPAHPAIVQGIKGTVRIPTDELVGWFEGFGFVKGKPTKNKRVDEPGYHMSRLPR